MATITSKDWPQRLWQVVRGDLRRFFGRANLLRMAGGLLVGGVLANSPLDANLHAAWQRDLRTPAGDRMFAGARQCGYARNIVASSGAALVVGILCASQPACAAVGAWGVQMARAGVVAVPLLGTGQGLLGGNRPSDGREQGSYWRVFTYPHGVHGISGHALGGALLFLTAAEMVPHPAVKTALYACSVMPGLSRINTSSHYPSQVLLGWWLAFLTVRTVRRAAGRELAEPFTLPCRR